MDDELRQSTLSHVEFVMAPLLTEVFSTVRSQVQTDMIPDVPMPEPLEFATFDAVGSMPSAERPLPSPSDVLGGEGADPLIPVLPPGLVDSLDLQVPMLEDSAVRGIVEDPPEANQPPVPSPEDFFPLNVNDNLNPEPDLTSKLDVLDRNNWRVEPAVVSVSESVDKLHDSINDRDEALLLLLQKLIDAVENNRMRIESMDSYFERNRCS